MKIENKMKKMVVLLWALTCLFFLEGCQAGRTNDSDASSVGIEENGLGDKGNKMEQPDDMRQSDGMQQGAASEEQRGQAPKADPEEQRGQAPKADSEEQRGQAPKAAPEEQSGQASKADPETQSGQAPGTAPETQVLELGNVDNLGLGFMVCAVPARENEDYRLYFFGIESDSEDRFKSFSEMEFDLGEADYVFPDVREGNASIGRFVDIYFFDRTEIGDAGRRDWLIIARYDVDGKMYYDTRAYMWSENGYCVDEELMQELNGKSSDSFLLQLEGCSGTME